MTTENTLTDNEKSFQSWLEVTEADRPQFASFVDGDLVEEGNNFSVISTNASFFKSLRGHGAEMDVFDSRTQEKIPS